METWDAIRARRKIAAYEAKPIREADLERILEAGRRSPSSRNEQRWDFIVVRERSQLQRLAGVWRGAAHIADAAATIGVAAPHEDDPRINASINFDLGQAVSTMMIAATDVGVGSRHASVHDWPLGAAILDLPSDQRLTWLIGLGYPADRPLEPIAKPDRRSFDDVVHWDRW